MELDRLLEDANLAVLLSRARRTSPATSRCSTATTPTTFFRMRNPSAWTRPPRPRSEPRRPPCSSDPRSATPAPAARGAARAHRRRSAPASRSTPSTRALIAAESDFDGTDPRRFVWPDGPDAAPDPGRRAAFRVAIIGAGLAGVGMGIRLGQAGLAYTIFEKNTALGGTWWENDYPDLRVDVPNLFYSYSFAPQPPTGPTTTRPRRAPGLRRTLRRRVRRHASTSVRHRGARGGVRPGYGAVDGARQPARRRVTEFEYDAVVSAVGMLNRPCVPDLAGLDDVRRDAVPLVALADRPRRHRGCVSA